MISMGACSDTGPCSLDPCPWYLGNHPCKRVVVYQTQCQPPIDAQSLRQAEGLLSKPTRSIHNSPHLRRESRPPLGTHEPQRVPVRRFLPTRRPCHRYNGLKQWADSPIHCPFSVHPSPPLHPQQWPVRHGTPRAAVAPHFTGAQYPAHRPRPPPSVAMLPAASWNINSSAMSAST